MKQTENITNKAVHLTKFFPILGAIVFILFLIPAVITFLAGDGIAKPIVFLCFSLPGLFLIIAFVNCRIYYDASGFTAKNFFGLKRKFTYRMITAIKENPHETYIIAGKRRIMVDKYCIGHRDFITFVKRRYKTIHAGQALPVIKADKHDLFNGHIRAPGEFIFVWSLILVCFLVMGVVFVWLGWFRSASAENTVKQELVFTSGIIEGDYFRLTSDDGTACRISSWNKLEDQDAIQSICDGKSTVTVYTYEVTPGKKDEGPYFIVKAIKYGDGYILSFDETNRLEQDDARTLLLLLLACTVIYVAYIAASIAVGRNPEKYREEIVRIFFKDSYVIY